jgi:hypothetical protein
MTTPKLDTKHLKALDVLEEKILTLTADEAGLKALWKQLDFNGNNIVSLAEIDKLAVERYPLLNKKPALMRAYKKTTGKGTSSSTDCDFVEFAELGDLLKNLFYFNRLYHIFDKIDTDDDKRIDLPELKQGLALLKLEGKHKAEDVFKAIDANGGGIILFDEFCTWYAERGL